MVRGRVRAANGLLLLHKEELVCHLRIPIMVQAIASFELPVCCKRNADVEEVTGAGPSEQEKRQSSATPLTVTAP